MSPAIATESVIRVAVDLDGRALTDRRDSAWDATSRCLIARRPRRNRGPCRWPRTLGGPQAVRRCGQEPVSCVARRVGAARRCRRTRCVTRIDVTTHSPSPPVCTPTPAVARTCGRHHRQALRPIGRWACHKQSPGTASECFTSSADKVAMMAGSTNTKCIYGLHKRVGLGRSPPRVRSTVR